MCFRVLPFSSPRRKRPKEPVSGVSAEKEDCFSNFNAILFRVKFYCFLRLLELILIIYDKKPPVKNGGLFFPFYKRGTTMNKKRVLICLFGGIICSIICATGMKLTNASATIPILLASGIGNRILIGFVIGISRWKIHYLLHGALLGFIVTLSTSIGLLPQSLIGFAIYTSAGIIYGTLIEIFATKVFKAKLN